MRNQEHAAGQRRAGDLPEQPLSLTVAEAAQACGVSASTIRRYLRAGRFPGARRAPAAVAGQPGHWRIPTKDLRDAGLDRRRPAPSGDGPEQRSPAEPGGGRAEEDRIRALEHALALERSRRQAAEVLAAERARTIQLLETALAALGHPRPGAPPARSKTAPAASSSGVGPQRQPWSARQPGIFQMVPRPRRAKAELTQEERAAIIGRALSGQRPPKRRWFWQ